MCPSRSENAVLGVCNIAACRSSLYKIMCIWFNLNSLPLPQDGRTVTFAILDGIVQRVAVWQEILQNLIIYSAWMYCYFDLYIFK